MIQTIEIPKTYRERLIELAVGESFLVTGKEQRSIYSTITRIHKASDMRFTQRQLKDGSGEVRVWRIK